MLSQTQTWSYMPSHVGDEPHMLLCTKTLIPMLDIFNHAKFNYVILEQK